MHDFDWCATRSKRVENTVKAQWTRGHVLNSGQLRRPDGSSGGFYARCVSHLVLLSRLDPRVRLRSATKSSALHLELFDVHEHSLAHILCGRSRRRSLPISLTALPDVSQIAFLPHGHQNPCSHIWQRVGESRRSLGSVDAQRGHGGCEALPSCWAGRARCRRAHTLRSFFCR